MHKLSSILLFLLFALSACSGNVPAATAQTQDTITPFPTLTDTPIPSNTPSPTPTITATATITPTATVTPENFVLADSGYDIANVKIVYPEPGEADISFDYRINQYDTEYTAIGIMFPSVCPVLHSAYYPGYPELFVVPRGPFTGSGQIVYRLHTQGECNVPFFYVAIYSPFGSGYWPTVDQIVYRERIELPLKVVRDLPSINAETLTLKNFSYQPTGPWSGRLAFHYAFSPEIPIDREIYRFNLVGMGGINACEFGTNGPVITKWEGTYTIVVNFNFSENTRVDPSCPSKYSSLAYGNSVLYLEDLRSGNPRIIYQHAIDLVITLKKQP